MCATSSGMQFVPSEPNQFALLHLSLCLYALRSLRSTFVQYIVERLPVVVVVAVRLSPHKPHIHLRERARIPLSLSVSLSHTNSAYPGGKHYKLIKSYSARTGDGGRAPSFQSICGWRRSVTLTGERLDTAIFRMEKCETFAMNFEEKIWFQHNLYMSGEYELYIFGSRSIFFLNILLEFLSHTNNIN